MYAYLIGEIFQALGTIMIGIMALRVHDKLLHDKHLDRNVFKRMRREQRIGKIGVALIAIGFVIKAIDLV
jgi:hypothetical protein